MIKWFNVADCRLSAINMIIGGRGIGKTYSALSYVLDKGKPFIYLRNTDVQLKECMTAFGNPFKRINTDKGYDIFFKTEKSHALIYDGNREDGQPIGYGLSLSTFENLRGIDLQDVCYVIFDEFIEKRTLSFKQFECFVSFYETVNRNRELLGEDALQVILLSNSQKLANPILAGYNLIPIIEKMILTGQSEYRKQALYICLPVSEVSDLKRATANYQLINGTQYASEALDNAFAFDSFYGIKKRNINEYMPLCQIDDIFLYKHKSQALLYACHSQAQNIPVFSSRDNITAFLRAYGRKLLDAASKGYLEYADFVTKNSLLEIIK